MVLLCAFTHVNPAAGTGSTKFDPLPETMRLQLKLEDAGKAILANNPADWSQDEGEVVVHCLCELPYEFLDAPDAPKQLIFGKSGRFSAMLFSYSPRDDLEAVFGGECAPEPGARSNG